MPRHLTWLPVACPAEGFNAPIGDVCLQLWNGSRPCLRTLGGEELKKRAFMEELGLEDVPCRLLAVVQRQPSGGWQQLGSANDLAKQAQQQRWQIPAPPAAAGAALKEPAAAHPAVSDQPGQGAPVAKSGRVIDLTVSPQKPAVRAPAAAPRPPVPRQAPAQPPVAVPAQLAGAAGEPAGRAPQQPAVQPAAPVQHLLPAAPVNQAALRHAVNFHPNEELGVQPAQPAPAAPGPPQHSPAQPPGPVLLAQARGSSARRRSLLACPACKSAKRGASAAEAAEALTCPLCYCETDPEHTHLDCGHPYCNLCLANYLHSAYQGGKHPKCQKPGCEQLLSEEDLQQGVLVLCDCPDVRRQRAVARLPLLDDPLTAYQRFTALAAAAVARERGDLIECQRCRFMILAEADAPEDAPCPNCRRGRPLLEARQAAERPRGIQQVEGERVLFCPSCAFGPQQKAMYCNKLKCGGCSLMLCWCCGEVIGEQRAYDHFADGKCPLYGLPGERPELTAAEMEQAQERAVQREPYYQGVWDLIVHPAHDAVRGMRRSTPPDMQADDALWRRMHGVMHGRLEQAFNEVTEAAAAREERLPLWELRAQLLPRARTLIDAAWRGWDVWEGVVASVLQVVDHALTSAAQRMPPALQRLAIAVEPPPQPQHGHAGGGNAAEAEPQPRQPAEGLAAVVENDNGGAAGVHAQLRGLLQRLQERLQAQLVDG